MSGAPAPPPGSRGGRTYSPVDDYDRLNRQARDVWDAMRDMAWHTLPELSGLTGHPEASVSARLRDFRKDQFGGHEVQRERVPNGNGLHRYRLVPISAPFWTC